MLYSGCNNVINFTVEMYLSFSLFKSQSIHNQQLYKRPDDEEVVEETRETVRIYVRLNDRGGLYAPCIALCPPDSDFQPF